MRSSLAGLAGWLKNSFVDFPGTVSTVLFFSGCNLRCPYCHNSSLILFPDDLSGIADTLEDFLRRRKKDIDGVVFTGGEPTLHQNVPEFMAEVRAMGYRVKLDSNGLLPEMIEQCRPDYLALDIKTAPHRYGAFLHARYPDIDVRLARSLAIVKTMGADAEVRITVAPGIVTGEIIQELRGLLEGVDRVFLQPVNLRKGVLDAAYFESLPPYSGAQIEEFRAMIAGVAGSCVVRDG